MTPPEAAVARRAVDPGVRSPRPVRAPETRAPLTVVPTPVRAPRVRRRRGTELVALLVVTFALLAVVVGHSMLAQGQVRLSSLQGQLVTEQARNQQLAVSVAQLETPARIVQEAEQTLHMVVPPAVQQLASVPLTTPLPGPKVVALPPPTTVPHATATTTPTGAIGASGTSTR